MYHSFQRLQNTATRNERLNQQFQLDIQIPQSFDFLFPPRVHVSSSMYVCIVHFS